jgi:ribosomal-protein-alanine N-acetyltransferase
VRLETERLVLRDFVEDDWRELHAIESRADVNRYQGYDAHTEEYSRSYVAKTIAAAAETPRMLYEVAIAKRADETQLIGRGGIRRTAAEPRIGEMWVVLAPDQQKQGLVFEAARAMMSHAFAELGMHRLYGDCDPRNGPSARLMERLGMRREAHFVQNVFIKGEWCDSLIYAVLASEWSALVGEPSSTEV